MTQSEDGHRLIEECQKHLLRVMGTIPDCEPGSRGAGSVEIERKAGFDLSLQGQDNWLTWSLLREMARDGIIDIVRAGRARYRLPMKQ
jgi:hypothetical protein